MSILSADGIGSVAFLLRHRYDKKKNDIRTEDERADIELLKQSGAKTVPEHLWQIGSESAELPLEKYRTVAKVGIK
jgi:hypothetical protein